MPNSAWLSSPELYNDVPVHRCLGCPFGEVAWTEMLWAQHCRGCSRDAALPGHTGSQGAKGLLCPSHWDHTACVFPDPTGSQLGGFIAPCKSGMLRNPTPIHASQYLIFPGKPQSCAATSLSTEHQPILVLFDCELWKIQQAASIYQIPGSSSPFAWCMEVQILSNDQLHFWSHWAPWQSLGVAWLFLFLSE